MFGDNFLQGLTQQVSNTLNQSAQSASDYISANAGDALISIATGQGGNLSASDIAAGKTGSPPQSLVAKAVAPLADIANANPGAAAAIGGGSLLIVGLAVAYFLLMKKG